MSAARAWTVRALPSDSAGHAVALALDAQRAAQVAVWRDVGTPNARLTLSRRHGDEWHDDEVVAAPGARCALAFDARGTPMVAFVDIDRRAVMLASNPSGSWQLEVVADAAAGTITTGAAIAVDTDGNPVVGYATDAGPCIANGDGAGHWTTRAMSSRTGHDVALAIGPAGARHAVVRDVLADTLTILREGGRGWEATEFPWRDPLSHTGFLGDGPALALDPSGRPHVAYWTDAGIHHATEQADGTWTGEVVVPADRAGGAPALALDPDGSPLIAVADPTTGGVALAWRDGDGWHVDEVGRSAATPGSGGSVALAVDDLGASHVAYVDDETGAVWAAQLNRAPVAKPARFTTFVNTALSGKNVLDHVDDREHDAVTVTTKPVRAPRRGKLVLRATGRFTYTPKRGFSGVDTFQYEVSDAHGAVAVGTVTIRVEVPVLIRARDKPLSDRRRASSVRVALSSPTLSAMTGALQRRIDGEWDDVRTRRASQLSQLVRPVTGEWATGPYRLELRELARGYPVVRSVEFDMPRARGVELVLSGDASTFPVVEQPKPDPKPKPKPDPKPKPKPTPKPTPKPEPGKIPPFDPVAGKWSLWPVNDDKPWLRRGSRGDAVRYLQGVIAREAGGRITIDGIFETETARRVRDVQRFFRITVDGVVGDETWGVIDLLALR